MDKQSYNEMKKVKEKYFSKLEYQAPSIVDIGSQDFNGSYKSIFEGWNYVGVDLEFGKNVDVVMKSEFDTGLDDNSFDVVISGQCIEHCRDPFKLVSEMYRICKKDGYCVLTAPQSWPEHNYPADYWRYMPNGIKELLQISGFKVIDVYTKSKLTLRHGILKSSWGIGMKV